MKTWKIEYEIPPLRAIYWAYTEAAGEEEVRAIVKKHEPLWHIRRLTVTKGFEGNYKKPLDESR